MPSPFGLIAKAGSKLLGISKAHPIATALGATGTAIVVNKLAVTPILRGFFGDQQGKAIQQTVGERRQAMADALRMDRLQKQMLSNTARLAAADPRLYNEILAGRRLPRNGVRIGGTPRTDLMERLALSMAKGEFTQPDIATEFLDDLATQP